MEENEPTAVLRRSLERCVLALQAGLLEPASVGAERGEVAALIARLAAVLRSSGAPEVAAAAATLEEAVGALKDGDARRAKLLLEKILSPLVLLPAGSPTRAALINALVRDLGARSYLEIGCNDNACFREIDAPRKVGVDPLSGGTCRMTSDDFFASNSERFDVVFIDGLHTAEQVLRDFENALGCLNPGGAIVFHDCDPALELRQMVPQRTGMWNGNVWKAFLRVRTRPDVDAVVADLDHGCGVALVRPNGDPLPLSEAECAAAGWDDLVRDRTRWLRLTGLDAVRAWAKG